jgi:hypothetical protein
MNPPKGSAPPPPKPEPRIPKRSDGLIANTRAYLASQAEKPPYLRFAFLNPYNLSLLGGAVAAGVLTLNPVIALAALGIEAIWLLHAPDSKRLRDLLWDPRYQKLKQADVAKARHARIQALEPDDQRRVFSLLARSSDIEQLAAQNPSFTGDLLRAELSKTDRLVDSFIEMAVTCARYERYLGSVDLDQLERDRRIWESRVRNGKEGEPQTELAKKNFAIILKRLDKLREIRSYLAVARGQLDLIENSFQLIADQIVTMNSPGQLSGQLDELLDGVESIKQTAIDTERLLNVNAFET